MIYVLGALLLMIWYFRRFLPTRVPVFAALPQSEVALASRPWAVPGFVTGEDGTRIELRDKFVGFVDGTSMVGFGLAKGATIIGTHLDDEARSNLRPGDIVAVRAPLGYYVHGPMLRCIAEVDEPMLKFKRDSNGRDHTPLMAQQAIALIEHVVD